MEKNKLTIIVDKDKKHKDKLIICDKCRKYLGHYYYNEIITWNKINIKNCYCN